MELTVREDNYYKRLDKFLKNSLKDLSMGRLYSLLRKKEIKVNTKRINHGDFELKIGDKITIYGYEKREEIYKKEAILYQMDLDIVHEDKNLIIINKPAGLAVHSGSKTTNKTLINGLNYYGKINNFTPFLVHRLDKDTEGLIIVAKNRDTSRLLSEKIKEHNINKFYKTVVVGNTPDKGQLLSRLDNKTAKLKYEKIISFNIDNIDLSLLKIELITGRKHQIRRQFLEKEFPLLGDKKYGNFKINKALGFLAKTIYLQSYKINFLHPKTNKKIEFSLPLPKRFEKLLAE